jgi:hypothetical protein
MFYELLYKTFKKKIGWRPYTFSYSKMFYQCVKAFKISLATFCTVLPDYRVKSKKKKAPDQGFPNI